MPPSRFHAYAAEKQRRHHCSGPVSPRPVSLDQNRARVPGFAGFEPRQRPAQPHAHMASIRLNARDAPLASASNSPLLSRLIPHQGGKKPHPTTGTGSLTPAQFHLAAPTSLKPPFPLPWWDQGFCTVGARRSLLLRKRPPIGGGACYCYILHHSRLQETHPFAGFLCNCSQGRFGMGQPPLFHSTENLCAQGRPCFVHCFFHLFPCLPSRKKLTRTL
jgi:hypothetical protein